MAHGFVKHFDPEDLNSDKSYDTLSVYGQSKLCNILFSLALSEKLRGTGNYKYLVIF